MAAVATIISGGQTGVDRAALEVARELALPYGGWCPKGGWAEDLPQPPGLLALYPLLRETPLADPAQRTEWNVRDADATLIVVAAGGVAVSRGTTLARDLAQRYGKPLLLVDLDAPDAVERALAWLRVQRNAYGPGFRLGIGGPRESEAAGIAARSTTFLRVVLSRLARDAP
jgi:Circularly permutated YpsA SLOG family